MNRANARKGQKVMYPNNIYVKHYEEIKKLTGDIGVPELLSVEDKRLLGI